MTKSKSRDSSKQEAKLSMKITSTTTNYPIMGDESLMCPKKHGSSNTHVQKHLRWSVDRYLAEHICNYNRDHTEPIGYLEFTSTFEEDAPNEVNKDDGRFYFYDSNSGKNLFTTGGQGTTRSFREFMKEALKFGSPFFRDDEVNWKYVRCLPPGGEVVSIFGTHLGLNVPDEKGNKYCINLVSIAGRPSSKQTKSKKSSSRHSSLHNRKQQPGSSWIESIWHELENETLPSKAPKQKASNEITDRREASSNHNQGLKNHHVKRGQTLRNSNQHEQRIVTPRCA